MKSVCVFIQSSRIIISNMVSLRPGELCFLDEQSFLSNFYLLDVKHKEYAYRTAEHLFQVAKCVKECYIEKGATAKIRNAATAKMTKILGRFVEVRAD